ncbi:MAG TPA: hypothetical protein VL358_10365 [Caulobacteraceae bacterium]|jgi:hypothetical protein|nr:hypothetical protein [Caulobacteraceae bacterium]
MRGRFRRSEMMEMGTCPSFGHHLHRYMAEFDFRYSNRIANGVGDTARATLALKGVVGKRLTYRQPDRQSQAAQM